MYRQILASVALAVLATGASAGRPVTDEERAKLVAAITAQGCTGGEMEFDDDGHFEVDDARCGDGREYDLKFDASFNFVGKDSDD